MHILKKILTHLNLILAGVFITFVVLDNYNPTMEWLTNASSIKLLLVFCILTIINSVISIFSKNSQHLK